MKIVYWIEDEPEKTTMLSTILRRHGVKIITMRNASECCARFGDMAAEHGAIILDLCLPAGEMVPCTIKSGSPEIGLWLLGKIREKFGTVGNVTILSGNLSVDVIERLENDFSVQSNAIFPKPLLEPDALVEIVVGQARSNVDPHQC